MIDSAVMGSIIAQVANGALKKEDSRFVTDKETAEFWDRMVVEVAEIRKKGWGVDTLQDF